MGKMAFGVALPAVTNIPEFARQAEACNFDFLGCGEHMMFHGPVPNTFIALSIAAGATQRIKLLSSVVLLPLYQPVIVAKMASVLDVASGGRYHLGVGIGGEFPKEFEACGVPLQE
ncbi:MAG: LLM class flavin-dependent oxidoreductase, partial [Candidatus Binatia bacterium]